MAPRLECNNARTGAKPRGIVPTPHAQVMWKQARTHLDHLRAMANPEPFNSADARRIFRIGTADLNADLLWRGLRQQAEQFAPGIGFHAVPNSQGNTEEQLTNAEIDLAIRTNSGSPDLIMYKTQLTLNFGRPDRYKGG